MGRIRGSSTTVKDMREKLNLHLPKVLGALKSNTNKEIRANIGLLDDNVDNEAGL